MGNTRSKDNKGSSTGELDQQGGNAALDDSNNNNNNNDSSLTSSSLKDSSINSKKKKSSNHSSFRSPAKPGNKKSSDTPTTTSSKGSSKSKKFEARNRQDSYTNAIFQQQHQEHAQSLPNNEELRSMHARLVREREQPVHEIYDIIDEIGHGGCLCKVFCIQKKQEYIGGSSRPEHVARTGSGSSLQPQQKSTRMRLFKKLQSLGTITIRAPNQRDGKDSDDDDDDDDDEYDLMDPWNSPSLRFLHSKNNRQDTISSAGDDSVKSASAHASASPDQEQQQQQQTTSADTTTATAAVTEDNTIDSTSVTKAATAVPPSKPMYFALKVINLAMVKEDKIAQLKNEVEILKTLDHQNIIKAYETFNTKRQIMMIMELCTGGDLHSRMPYTECQVAYIVRQILSAIRYIHARHIVHRDIKLENIMFESTHPQAAIKLIDFGLSKNYSPSSHHILTERVGTLYSMSPETMRGIAYTTQADLWSIGVIAYILLANGSLQPFEGKTPKQVVANVLRARYSFDNQEVWGHISQHAKDFINSLLVLEPTQRLTASTAREHPWFDYCKKQEECLQLELEQQQQQQSSSEPPLPTPPTGARILMRGTSCSDNDEPDDSTTNNDTSHNDDDDVEGIFKGHHKSNMSMSSLATTSSQATSPEFKHNVVKSILEYADMGEFRKLALNVIAKKSSSSEIFELRRVFEEFDTLDTGTITLEEFSAALAQFQYSPRDIHKIFTKVDVNRDNCINYTEFLAAALETQGTIEEYRLAEAFDLMDDDDSGFISHENLRRILPKAKYSDDYVNQLIAEGDSEGNGCISYEDFLQVFAKKKHDRIKAIYYDDSDPTGISVVDDGAAKFAGDDSVADSDESASSNDSSLSTDDVLRRYGIIQSLRRGWSSGDQLARLVKREKSKRLASGDDKKMRAKTTPSDDKTTDKTEPSK